MVKLIRLTSSNNGIFECNFSTHILLNTGSKLALQNLTFSTVFDTITITPENNLISFRGNINEPFSTFLLPIKIYKGVNGTQDFLDDLAIGLNSTLKAIKQTPAPFGLFSEFSVNDLSDTNSGDKTTITYQYIPLVTPLGPMYKEGEGSGRSRNIPFWTATPGAINIELNDKLNNITHLTTGTARTVNNNYNYITNPNFPLSRGNALFSATVWEYVDNGEFVNNNGFAIGLTQTNLSALGFPKNESIPQSARNLEIRLDRDNVNYVYIEDSGFEKNSSVLPLFTDGSVGIQNNDTLFFRIGQSTSADFLGKRTVVGGVWQAQPAPPNNPIEAIIFERELTEVENKGDWFPYMYIRGAEQDIKVANLQYTPSLKNVENFTEFDRIFNDSANSDGVTRTNAANDSTIPILWKDGFLGPVTPTLQLNRWSILNVWKNLIGRIEMNLDIWKYLGFTQTTNVGNSRAYIEQKINKFKSAPTPSSAVWTADELSALNLDDCFIVELENLPLDCYDASATSYGAETISIPEVTISPKSGRRKNILMTIPVTDNNDGLVQYRTNTPVFIDIRNTAPMLLKNLQLKVLRKDFSQIRTKANESIMTLLLDTGE